MSNLLGPVDPRNFSSGAGGAPGGVKPGGIYIADVKSVATTTSNTVKAGYAKVHVRKLNIDLPYMRVAGQSPTDPLVVGDQVLVSFLDNKLFDPVILGRLDSELNVFIPTADTDGKGGTREAFEGTLIGEKVSVTGSGTNALNVTNGITASTGQFTSINANSHSHVSDVRAKTRIKPLTDALDKIKRLVGIKYKMKTAVGITVDFPTMDGYQYGILAQDSALVVPSAVTYDAEEDHENVNGWARAYGVDYGSLVAVLIEAVKELSERVEELENGQNHSSDVG
jgi:hypothetical protein